MRRNKLFIVLAISLLAIGFATVSTVLYINGSTSYIGNQSDFDAGVIFTDTSATKGTSYITDSGKTIEFTSSTLSVLNETSVVNYTITNKSREYDANVIINCGFVDSEGNSTTNDLLTITKSDEKHEIESGGSATGSITIKLIKNAEAEFSQKFTCTLVATAVERTTAGEFEEDDYTLKGVLTDEDGNPIENGLLAACSEPIIITTNEDGEFATPGLELGGHTLYYLGVVSDTLTVESVSEMNESELSEIAISKGYFTTSATNYPTITGDGFKISVSVTKTPSVIDATDVYYTNSETECKDVACSLNELYEDIMG